MLYRIDDSDYIYYVESDSMNEALRLWREHDMFGPDDDPDSIVVLSENPVIRAKADTPNVKEA